MTRVSRLTEEIRDELYKAFTEQSENGTVPIADVVTSVAACLSYRIAALEARLEQLEAAVHSSE